MCEPCGDTPEDNVTVFLVGADQKDQELRRAVFGKGISAAQTVFYCPQLFNFLPNCSDCSLIIEANPHSYDDINVSISE